MTTTLGNQPWVLKKVLVHAPDHNVFCVARLRIIHGQTIVDGQTANQASISLSIMTTLANLNSRPQALTLSIPPQRVEKCGLAQSSNNTLCPSYLLSSLPAPVANVSAISTLSLCLNTVGIVLCPSGMESLIPATPGDLEFHSFAKICQSKLLRLHFSERQFLGNDLLDELQKLSNALRQRTLQAVPLDTARHTVLEKDWRVFALSPDPPPYLQESLPEQKDPPLYLEQVVGKRRRDPKSRSPDDKERKRPYPPSLQLIGSPTEVNTPSTRASFPSPSIYPTHFRCASSPGQTGYQRLAHLEHELRGVSGDLIRRLLIRSGHELLLAIPKDVDRRLARELEPVSSSPETDMMIKRQVEQYVDETIEYRLAQYIDETIECRFAQHVDHALSECRDQANDLYTQKEFEFQELIDDGNVEVRNTANDCTEEMEEQVQGYMGRIEEQAQRCMKNIEDRGTKTGSEDFAKSKLQPWSNASAQPSLDGKSSTRHGLGARTRRSSV